MKRRSKRKPRALVLAQLEYQAPAAPAPGVRSGKHAAGQTAALGKKERAKRKAAKRAAAVRAARLAAAVERIKP